MTSEEFTDFISKNEICDFHITRADTVACVKSTCYNLCKASVAHDIRTPITILEGYTEYLQRNLKNGKADEETLSRTLAHYVYLQQTPGSQFMYEGGYHELLGMPCCCVRLRSHFR